VRRSKMTEKSHDPSRGRKGLANDDGYVDEIESEEDLVEMAVMDALTGKTSKLTRAHVQDLVKVIKGLTISPVSAEAMKEMRRRENKSIREKHVLNEAAILLRRELEQLQQDLSGRQGAEDAFTLMSLWRAKQIEAALPALDCPRVYYLRDYNENTKILQDPIPAAWMAMAGLISRFALEALRAGGSTQTTVGSRDGPVVRCVQAALQHIQPDEKVPARSTILDAIQHVFWT
jgi:hypothetical protein